MFSDSLNRRARADSGRLRGRYLLLLTTTWFILIGCLNAEPTTVVVTEVVVVEGGERIVTRLVQQTVAVTVTPGSAVSNDSDRPVRLDLSLTGVTPNIDPQKTDDSGGLDLIENLFVGLTNYNHEKNEIEPELAREWEVSDDGRIWTFRLRDDVFWVRPVGSSPLPDGSWQVDEVRPVIAADVLYAVQRACLRETNAPDAFILFLVQGCSQLQQQIETPEAPIDEIGVRALDDLTVEFTLTEPASHFLTITALPILRPVPRELVDELGDEWQSAEGLITSGPFVLAPDSLANGRLILHRSPSWPLPFQGNVDFVTIALLTDEAQAFQLWQAKQLDLSPLPATERQSLLEDTPERGKLVTGQTVFYLGFNLSSSVLREPAVRRALSAAIDRERLAEELYGGTAIGMRHLAPPGVIAAPPIDEIGKGYDPDYARQQMAESGVRSCRLMSPITYLASSSDLSLQQAELIREMWAEELGCEEDKIIIEQVQFGTLLANTRQDAGSARPDIWELGWASYYPDANNWVGDLLHCNESENRQGRPCSEVDDMIREAATGTGNGERLLLYRQIEDLFFGANGIEPIAPLYVPGEFVAVQSWLSYSPALFGGEQYDTYRLQFDLKRLEQSR